MSGLSLRYMPCYNNMLNRDNDKKYRKLTTNKKQIFFDCRADTNLVGEVKSLPPNFKRIT